MRMLLIAIAILTLQLPANVALAQGRAREAGEYLVSVTPLIGFRMGGDFDDEETDAEVSLDDESMVGLAINAPFDTLEGDSYTEWEFYYSRQKPGLDSAPENVDPSLELEISHFLIGGTYVGGGDLMRPFLSAGIGAAHLSPDAPGHDSDTVFGFGIGLGAQVFPASRVGLRFEGRMLGSVIDSDSAIFCASGSVGSACAFRASGDLLWQWEIAAGATFRF